MDLYVPRDAPAGSQKARKWAEDDIQTGDEITCAGWMRSGFAEAGSVAGSGLSERVAEEAPPSQPPSIPLRRFGEVNV